MGIDRTGMATVTVFADTVWDGPTQPGVAMASACLAMGSACLVMGSACLAMASAATQQLAMVIGYGGMPLSTGVYSTSLMLPF